MSVAAPDAAISDWDGGRGEAVIHSRGRSPPGSVVVAGGGRGHGAFPGVNSIGDGATDDGARGLSDAGATPRSGRGGRERPSAATGGHGQRTVLAGCVAVATLDVSDSGSTEATVVRARGRSLAPKELNVNVNVNVNVDVKN